MEALEAAAAEGAVSINDAAALQRILEAVQDLCYYEPEGAIKSRTGHECRAMRSECIPQEHEDQEVAAALEFAIASLCAVHCALRTAKWARWGYLCTADPPEQELWLK